MKVFISSVIRDFSSYRDAAAAGARTLAHEVTRAEDFGASAASPQQVCLAGVRAADVVVLILGAAYGAAAPGAMSPTHEEYREARERGDVLVFIQSGITFEPREKEFVDEVQGWSRGQYTVDFTTPEDLQGAVIRALHDLQLSRMSGDVDEAELLARAQALMPNERSSSPASLCVIVTGGPKQQVLRPAQLEARPLRDTILQTALFGDHRIFDQSHGSTTEIERHHLVIRQEGASILLSQLSDVCVIQPTNRDSEQRSSYLPVIVEEDVRDGITRALRFTAWLLDHVDSRRRLGWVAPMVALAGAGYMGWLTRAERDAHPNSVSMGMRGQDAVVSTLAPAARARPSLGTQADEIADDLTVLLRREMRR